MENNKIKILQFLRQKQTFAISFDSLVGIFYDARPNFLPNNEHPVIGVIGYEGKVIPVIDLTKDGNKPRTPLTQGETTIQDGFYEVRGKPNDNYLILIIKSQENQEFGILTDTVEEIIEYNKEEIISEGQSNPPYCGINSASTTPKRPITVIDPIGLAYLLNSKGWFNKKEGNYANHKTEK